MSSTCLKSSTSFFFLFHSSTWIPSCDLTARTEWNTITPLSVPLDDTWTMQLTRCPARAVWSPNAELERRTSWKVNSPPLPAALQTANQLLTSKVVPATRSRFSFYTCELGLILWKVDLKETHLEYKGKIRHCDDELLYCWHQINLVSWKHK